MAKLLDVSIGQGRCACTLSSVPIPCFEVITTQCSFIFVSHNSHISYHITFQRITFNHFIYIYSFCVIEFFFLFLFFLLYLLCNLIHYQTDFMIQMGDIRQKNNNNNNIALKIILLFQTCHQSLPFYRKEILFKKMVILIV